MPRGVTAAQEPLKLLVLVRTQAGQSSFGTRVTNRFPPYVGQVDSGMSRIACIILLSVVTVLGTRRSVYAQLLDGEPDTTTASLDLDDVLSVGRSAQAGFERRRLRYLPRTMQPARGSCDERVGRFCTWYTEGEWYPVMERAEIVELRSALLATLDSLQALLPEDPWLLGQRVWYRAEGGDWGASLTTARRCQAAERWWCEALTGFALHGLGRYPEAERTFEVALSRMDRSQAQLWRRPSWAVDSDARELLDATNRDTLRETGLLRRLWRMADPLYLVAGNDRETAHYARWTVAALRGEARNPFHIRWGKDLDELTIRHGWEMGWERSPSLDFSTLDHVIGHKHPEGRDFMPTGAVLLDPSGASPEALQPGRQNPKSLYAPKYAPVLLPMEGQLAFFPRGSTTVIVATHFLPEDTTFHAAHSHPLPWMDQGIQGGMLDRAGLFAWSTDMTTPEVTATTTGSERALMVSVPAGEYVVSVEHWSPKARRAGRRREGAVASPAPDDIATLSDLILLRPTAAPPETLEAALTHTLVRTQILSGQPLAIGWEVSGLGFRPEVLRYQVSVERVDRGVWSRIGSFLRLSDRAEPLIVAWEEAGPDTPGHDFRYLDLDSFGMEEGVFEIRLTLQTANRSVAETTQRVRVVG
jgi:hypothetical protein